MKRLLITCAAIATATVASSEEVAPEEVNFSEYGELEVSLSGVAGDAAAGLEIMVSRGKGNCIACHQVSALEEHPFHGEVGPTLDGVGEYRTEAELRGIVANAKMTFEGSIMPAFYRTSGFIRPGDAYTGKAAEGELAPLLTAQEIEDVVAYLLTLKD
ncbi:sulfur oxidation c-type cytochrome SoxX [Yoonia sp. I 8.24]|uniref:sulfur oxidation c-type cytochrome SoxX n=1 Tax=Yoonia sp. I 8.24 TaxID=1537229 RepID=UPI001EDFFA66|nr:sulfur oxidation c-type cytochrome SoxX [Yoonia sp. I 8.24]MCG3266614.1 sulfur oxidation c-type cytochrome SoxX [Yoonia sp. I 8.24]